MKFPLRSFSYRTFFIFVLACMSFVACSDDQPVEPEAEKAAQQSQQTQQPQQTQQTQQDAPAQDSTGKTGTPEYFPVLDYLKGELNMADSVATVVRRITTINGKTDSGYMPVEQFIALMQEFVPADLSKDSMEKNFTETSFFDQANQLSTFTYSVKKNGLPFQRVDVIVKATESYDKVSSIYLEKFFSTKDSKVTKKILINGGRSVSINTETIRKGMKPVARQEKLIWNTWDPAA